MRHYHFAPSLLKLRKLAHPKHVCPVNLHGNCSTSSYLTLISGLSPTPVLSQVISSGVLCFYSWDFHNEVSKMSLMCWPYYISYILFITKEYFEEQRSVSKLRYQGLSSVLSISYIYIVIDMRWLVFSFILISKKSCHLYILLVASWLLWSFKWSLLLIHGYINFRASNCVYLQLLSFSSCPMFFQDTVQTPAFRFCMDFPRASKDPHSPLTLNVKNNLELWEEKRVIKRVWGYVYEWRLMGGMKPIEWMHGKEALLSASMIIFG